MHRYLLKIRFSTKFLNSTWNRLRYKIRLNSCKMSTQNEDLTSSFPISILHNNRKKKIHFAQKIRIHAMLHNHNRNAFREISTHRENCNIFFTQTVLKYIWNGLMPLLLLLLSAICQMGISFFFERGFRNINASQLRI